MAAKDENISDVQKQELEDSTSCCICAETYKCPKLLPCCGHTFCMNCIQETGLKTSKGPGDEMPCPICRRQFRIPSEGFTGLQNNYYVQADQSENLTTVGLKEKKEVRSKKLDKNKEDKESNRRRVLWNTHTYRTKLVLLSASNSITTVVRQHEMTKMQNMDVMVTCINHHLDIDGPLAEQIIKAAGPSVVAELVRHKTRLRFLQTGDLVHTSAGNLKGLKAIIHIVGPQMVTPNYQMPRDALRNVFTNCLRYANDELKFKSICLPPIGIDLYDGQMVVDGFMDAVEMFASTVDMPSGAAQDQPNPHYLNYIELVSSDLQCTEQLIKCTKTRLGAK